MLQAALDEELMDISEGSNNEDSDESDDSEDGTNTAYQLMISSYIFKLTIPFFEEKVNDPQFQDLLAKKAAVNSQAAAVIMPF